MADNNQYLVGNPEITLRDYQHASKLFRDGVFRLAPKHGFLFHVAFDFGNGIGFGEENTTERIEAGLLVKQVALPSFSIDNKVQNAYNRKNVIQSKINYSDIRITFHDDSANLTNSMWQAYYEYYYGDSYGSPESYALNTKYSDMTRQDWGFIPADKPFFKSIRIYSLYQNKYTGYTLINPLITNWSHGRHDVSGDNLMENEMTVQYETLLYSQGVITEDGDEPKFMTEAHYDTTVSPLGKAEGGNPPPENVVASGGAIRSAYGIFSQFIDNDISGGLIDVALSNNRDDLKTAAVGELERLGENIVTGNETRDRYNFPTPIQQQIDSFQDRTKIVRAANNISNEPQVGSRDLRQYVTSNNQAIAQRTSANPKTLGKI